MKLRGKVALVTGAAKGIGAAVARRFHDEGAVVYALDQEIAEGSVPLPGIRAVSCDVRHRAAVQQAVAEIARHHASIDILVNNAGVNPEPAAVEKTAPEQLDIILETNLKSIFHVSTAVLPHMKSGGTIINIASILGLRGVPACAAYTASKGGVIALSRAMAKDCAPGIRVNVISPGAVATAMFDDYLARVDNPVRERERICREIPLQRLGDPGDIAAAAVFLASDDASWITGQNLVVDGGDSI